jgi:hypothetical protein
MRQIVAQLTEKRFLKISQTSPLYFLSEANRWQHGNYPETGFWDVGRMAKS